MLADVEAKAKELQEAQAKDDVITFLATVDEYTRLIGSVRVAFSSREKAFIAWQNAEAEVRRVRAAHEKAKRQGTQAANASVAEVVQAERRSVDRKLEFDAVTKLVKVEQHRFELERVDDFKDSLDEFLESMIKRQKELIKTWEDYQSLLLKRSGINPGANGVPSGP